jgi:hypothetical protein
MRNKFRVKKIICTDERDQLYVWNHEEVEDTLNTYANYWGDQTPIRDYTIEVKDE